MKKQKCAVYCRVSTADQDISKQREQLPEFAKSQGWQIFDTYVDEGISGASIDARPDFKRLLDDMVNEKFNILLVEVQDRITRTENLQERGLIMQMLIDYNVTLWSPSEGPCDLSDFAGEITSTIKFIIAAEERKNIARRTLKGKKAKLEKGMHSAVGGKLPFARNYDKETGKWSLDEDKANLIRWAVDEYLAGTSLRKIAEDLQVKHLLKVSYDTLLRTFASRLGDTWTIELKDGTSSDFQIPRILDDDTIKAVQEQIGFNRTYNRADIQRYPLNGFLKCSKCHRALNGQRQTTKGGKPYHYYRHAIRTKGKKDTCKAFTSVSAEKIEKGVFNVIFETVGDSPGFQKAIKESLPDTKLIESLKGKIIKGEKALKKVNREINKLVDTALEQTLKEEIIEIIKEKQDELLERKRYIEADLNSDKQRFESLPSLEKVQRDAEKIRQTLKRKFKSEEHLQSMGYDEKRELLYKLFPQGHDQDGQPYGIFLKKRKSGTWQYSICACIFDKMRFIKGSDYNYRTDDIVRAQHEALKKKRQNVFRTSRKRSDACNSAKGL